MAEDRQVRKLRKQLDAAQGKGDEEGVVAILEKLAAAEPGSARWPHKLGDLQRKLGHRERAITSYARAVEIYTAQGFIARAIAMAKTVLNLDPTRIDILERVDPQAAHELHQSTRQAAAEAGRAPREEKPTRKAAAPEGAPPARAARGKRDTRRHPAILDEGPAFEVPVEVADRAEAELRQQQTVAAAQRKAANGDAKGQQEADAAPEATKQAERETAAIARLQAAQEAEARAQRPAPPPLPPKPPGARRPITLDNLSLPPLPAMAKKAAPPALPKPPNTPGAAMAAKGGLAASVTDIYSSVLESIDELSIDPNAGADEVRFSNAPPPMRRSLSIELDLSDLELGESIPPDPQESPSAVSLSQLPLFPLFSELPKPALAHLVQAAELVELEPGEHLIRRGDDADALYGIVEGQVRVLAQGTESYLALGEGDVVGEACLLQDEPRSADVAAEGKVTALRIPRSAIYEVVAQHPRLAEILLELLTRRLLGGLLQTSPLFRHFDLDGKQMLARSFEIRRAAAGTLLAETDKRMDALYISLTGKLEVALPDGERKLYGPGSMFGQDAILANQPARCDVRAHFNMVVLRLTAERFLPVAMRFPRLLEELERLGTDPIVNISV